MPKQQEFKSEGEFEKRLFLALKRFGYLFPTNKAEVERIEELYGDTEIEIPENLKMSESLENENRTINFRFDLKAAAFSGTKNDKFEFPKDENSEDSSNSK